MIVCDRCARPMPWANDSMTSVAYEDGDFHCIVSTEFRDWRHVCECCRREIVKNGTPMVGGIGRWKKL